MAENMTQLGVWMPDHVFTILCKHLRHCEDQPEVTIGYLRSEVIHGINNTMARRWSIDGPYVRVVQGMIPDLDGKPETVRMIADGVAANYIFDCPTCPRKATAGDRFPGGTVGYDAFVNLPRNASFTAELLREPIRRRTRTEQLLEHAVTLEVPCLDLSTLERILRGE